MTIAPQHHHTTSYPLPPLSITTVCLIPSINSCIIHGLYSSYIIDSATFRVSLTLVLARGLENCFGCFLGLVFAAVLPPSERSRLASISFPLARSDGLFTVELFSTFPLQL